MDPHPPAVLVTGATGGIGYFVAEHLAREGHRVVLAARDPAKADAAVRTLTHHVPDARLDVLDLDLADLASVSAAAARVAAGPPLSAIVANAALVGYSLRHRCVPQLSVDGVELHFATAHLGHYALLAALGPQLRGWGTRLVHVGSLSHGMARRAAWWGRRPGRTAADAAAPHGPWRGVTAPHPEPSLHSYARSKLAVTLLAAHLARTPATTGGPTSVLVHPGTAVDALTPERDGIPPSQPTHLRRIDRAFVRRMHGKDAAALILAHAAVSPAVGHGEHWGPGGAGQLSGPPARLSEPRVWRCARACASLLTLSERLTGLRLELGGDGTAVAAAPSHPWQ